MSASPPVPASIDYEPTGAKRWRWKRYAALAVLFAMALWGAYQWRSIERFYATSQAWLWQRRAMKHLLAPGTVVYSDDPKEITRLLTRPRYTRAFPNGPVIYSPIELHEMQGWREWEFQGMTGVTSGSITRAWGGVLLHERSTSNGTDELIAIDAIPFASTDMKGERFVNLTGIVIHPGSPWRFWSDGGSTNDVLLIVLKESDRFTLFAGQIDPTDSSRFSIGYSINGRPGKIEGRLRSDGSINLDAGGGYTLFSPGKQ